MGVCIFGVRVGIKFGTTSLVDEDFHDDGAAAVGSNWISRLPARLTAEPSLCTLIFCHGRPELLASIFATMPEAVESDRVLAIGFGSKGFVWSEAQRFRVIVYPHDVPNHQRNRPLHPATAALLARLLSIADVARTIKDTARMDSEFVHRCRVLLKLETAAGHPPAFGTSWDDVPIDTLRRVRAFYVLGPAHWETITAGLDTLGAPRLATFADFESWYRSQCEKKKTS